MSIVRIDLPDPTYQRAWSVANAAEKATLLASGVRRGDIIHQIDTGVYYLVVETGVLQPLGLAGPTGPTGATGATGPTGPTGPPVSVNWANESFSAGNFTADTSSWTVASGDVTANRYRADSKTLIWSLSIAATSTLGAGNSYLFVLLPGGVTTPSAAGGFTLKPAYFYNAGTVYLDAVVQVNDSTHIVVHRGGAALSAGSIGLYFTMSGMEIN